MLVDEPVAAIDESAVRSAGEASQAGRDRVGSSRSSASRNTTLSLRTAFNPALRAADSPWLFC